MKCTNTLCDPGNTGAEKTGNTFVLIIEATAYDELEDAKQHHEPGVDLSVIA